MTKIDKITHAELKQYIRAIANYERVELTEQDIKQCVEYLFDCWNYDFKTSQSFNETMFYLKHELRVENRWSKRAYKANIKEEKYLDKETTITDLINKVNKI